MVSVTTLASTIPLVTTSMVETAPNSTKSFQRLWSYVYTIIIEDFYWSHISDHLISLQTTQDDRLHPISDVYHLWLCVQPFFKYTRGWYTASCALFLVSNCCHMDNLLASMWFVWKWKISEGADELGKLEPAYEAYVSTTYPVEIVKFSCPSRFIHVQRRKPHLLPSRFPITHLAHSLTPTTPTSVNRSDAFCNNAKSSANGLFFNDLTYPSLNGSFSNTSKKLSYLQGT